MQSREPIFNVPGALVAVLAVLFAVHLVRLLLSDIADAELVLAMAFIPARYSGMAAELPGAPFAAATSFLTHMLVHADLTHLGFNAAWLLAFGGAIARRAGGVRFLAIACLTGIAGILLFWVMNPGLLAPVVGASGAVAGLMGATMRFLFSALDDGGIRQLREAPETVRRMGVLEALSDRRVQMTTLVWLLLNALAVFGLGGGPERSGIAWEAHIGGYLAGLLGFGLLDRQDPRPVERLPETL